MASSPATGALALCENFTMTTRTVRKMSCRQTNEQTVRQTERQTDKQLLLKIPFSFSLEDISKEQIITMTVNEDDDNDELEDLKMTVCWSLTLYLFNLVQFI